jgi:hypothetical protein
MAQREFVFDQQLLMSQGTAADADLLPLLLACIPGSLNAYKAAPANDRLGVDWWVEMPNARHLAIDVKVRAEDWAARHPEQDDLALETWSVVEANKVGWTRDPAKRCDYVLWLWQDTKRYCLLPFPMLCRVMQEHWQDWSQTYKTATQRTVDSGRTYHSECVFVPRHEIWRRVYNAYGGAGTRLSVVTA